MQKRSPVSYPLAKRQSYLPMRLGAEAALAVLIVAIFSLTSLQSILLRTPQFAAVITAVLVDLANTDRASADVGALTVNPILVAAAQAKANDMAAKGYFAHVSPEGLDSWYWFKQAGYSFTYAGENLAADFSDSADVENAWLASPTHRANLMNVHYTEIGIATAEGMYQGHPTTFVVQMFGTPAPSKLAEAASPAETAPTPAVIAAAPAVALETKPASAQVLGASESPSQPAPAASKPSTVVKTAAEHSLALATPQVTQQAPFWAFLVSSPKTTLRYAYYFLALAILAVMLTRTGIEIKLHHLRHIALAGGLAFMMAGLFFVADRMIFTSPQLVINTETSALHS